jgi:carbonic anhydrase/acetyltransferase-like protein (isoleucine patch superfamily)
MNSISLGPKVFVGPCAIIRADEPDVSGTVGSIAIGPECNMQDGVIIHSLGGKSVTIGTRVSLAHGCVVHGPCAIGDGCFVGFRAIVYNANLKERVFVGHGAIVEGVELEAGALVTARNAVSSAEQGNRLPTVGPPHLEFMEKVITSNIRLVQGYLEIC